MLDNACWCKSVYKMAKLDTVSLFIFPPTGQLCDPARGHPRTAFTFVDTVPHDNQHSEFGFKKQPVRRLESKLTHHMDLYL